ncbi:MAG TPA: hypothetical protein VEZ90_18290 [Blastocatellia bacterium]|nr:hypothetical protein [Blastocatellia bacterium]
MKQIHVHRGGPRFGVAAAATFCLFSLGFQTVSGQPRSLQASNSRKTQTGVQTFAAFWARFKAAVLQNDKEAVASMTQLPFDLENEQLDRAAFIARFDSLFDKRVKRYFAKAKPIRDQEYYEVFAGDNSFMFKKVGGQYKFVEIGVND